jgi:hypothetical protein
MHFGTCTLCGSTGTNKLTCPYNPMAINHNFKNHYKLQVVKKINNKKQYKWNGTTQKGGSLDIDVKTYECDRDYKNIPTNVINSFYFKSLFDQDPFIKFGQDVFGINNFTDKTIPDFKRKSTFREPSMSIKNLQEEQHVYLETCSSENECQMWLTVATINNQPYGCIFSFYRPGYDFMIQGISKFYIPGMFSFFYPEISNQLPKLNNLLIPAIESLAKKVGASRIVVRPIGNQGSILSKHYGFEHIDDDRTPCDVIFGWNPALAKSI